MIYKQRWRVVLGQARDISPAVRATSVGPVCEHPGDTCGPSEPWLQSCCQGPFIDVGSEASAARIAQLLNDVEQQAERRIRRCRLRGTVATLALAALSLVTLLSGCRAPSTPDTPPPAGGAPEGEYTVSFEVSVFDVNGLPVTRRVSIFEEVRQANGDYARRLVTTDDLDPVTGRFPGSWEISGEDPPRPEGWRVGDEIHQPSHYIRPTTWVRNISMGPNVVSATLTITYLGQGGESVQCRRLDANGPIPGSRMSSTVTAGPVGGAGSAVVVCTHLH